MSFLPLFQVDAFTDDTFRGNPAAVCPLNSWLPDARMQQIAAENNLSETAFFVGADGEYELRWFTPSVEVDLCGHATLATAHILWHELKEQASVLCFSTRSGVLRVRRRGLRYQLDFPLRTPELCEAPPALFSALGIAAGPVYVADDFIVDLASEAEVLTIAPDFSKLRGLPGRGVIVTAPGLVHDFVSRWFGPNVGVNEDPVTGSAHTALVPLWSERLGKTSLRAAQLSTRGGEIECELCGDRVLLTGSAVTYLRGQIEIPDART